VAIPKNSLEKYKYFCLYSIYMEELTTKIRKWGNSYGVIIPQEILRKKNLKEGEEIDVIMVKKGNVLRETFGTLKFKKFTEQMMKETDKELYDI
jgi:putative addiction module antidote